MEVRNPTKVGFQVDDSLNREGLRSYFVGQYKTVESELDGVPAVVKDHIHVKGLTARNGLSFQNDISKSSNNNIRLKALI